MKCIWKPFILGDKGLGLYFENEVGRIARLERNSLVVPASKLRYLSHQKKLAFLMVFNPVTAWSYYTKFKDNLKKEVQSKEAKYRKMLTPCFLFCFSGLMSSSIISSMPVSLLSTSFKSSSRLGVCGCNSRHRKEGNKCEVVSSEVSLNRSAVQ